MCIRRIYLIAKLLKSIQLEFVNIHTHTHTQKDAQLVLEQI